MIEKARRNAQIIEKYLSGSRIIDLSKELGLSRQRVHQILNVNGTIASRTRRSKRWYAMSIRNGRMIELHDSGETTSTIAKEFGVSNVRVRQILRENNYQDA